MKYLDEDITRLADSDYIKPLAGKSILVTGATGLLGSIAVKALCEFERRHHTGLRVLALARSAQKAETVFRGLSERDGLHIVVGDVNRPIAIDGALDFIIHGASVTGSKMFVEQPVETIDTLIGGTRNILELARAHAVEKVLFLSSLEVYGKPDADAYQMRESDVGYIDYTAVRSSYSEGKRLAECLCRAYGSEYGVPVVTVRLAQTFGPGVAPDDGRVFAQFARAVLDGQDITLNTRGLTYRNYCYTRDAVAAFFCVLTRGEPGEAYNVANPTTGITIANMAQMVCDNPALGNGGIQVNYHVSQAPGAFGYNPEMKIALVTDKLEALGWHAEVDLSAMYERMIADMRQERAAAAGGERQ